MAEKPPSTYDRYKSNTAVFLAWLIERGKVNGWQSPAGTGAKKNKKKGRSKTVYTFQLKDYRECAEVLANASPDARRLPKLIRQAARDAFTLRKRFSNWFARQAAGSDAEARSNASHRHFNTWFEDILHLLGQDFLDQENGTGAEFDGLSNRFASLQVEEPELADLIAKATEHTAPAAVGNTAIDVDELNDASFERMMAVFCLMEDFNAMRSTVALLWQFYRDGQMDLTSASIATNAVFEMAVSLESGLLEKYPEFCDYRKMFATLVGELIKNRETPLGKFESMGGRSFVMPVLFLRWNFYWMWISVMKTKQEPTDHLVLHAFLQDDDPLDQELHHIAMSREDPEEKRAFLQHRRFRKLYAEVELLKTADFSYLVEDSLTRHIREHKVGQPVGPASLLMHQILSDIWDIVESDDRCIEDLHRFRTYITDVATWIRTGKDKTDGELLETTDSIKRTLGEDNVAALLPHIKLGFAGGAIQPSSTRQKHVLFRMNPILSGTILFSCQTQWHDVGIECINYLGAVNGTVHLYHALRQTKFLNATWPDLEHLLLTHKLNEFFLGEKPKLLSDMVRQWVLVNGISPSFFSKENQAFLEANPDQFQASLLKKQTQKRRGRTSPTLLSDAIYNNLKSTQQVRFNRSDIISALYKRIYPHEDERSDQRPLLSISAFSRLPLDAQIMIIALSLDNEERSDRLFDNFKLHRRCFAFLRSLVPLATREMRAQIATQGESMDYTAILVNELYMKEGEALMHLGVRSDTDRVTGIVFSEIARLMKALINQEGDKEIKTTSSRMRASRNNSTKPIRHFGVSHSDFEDATPESRALCEFKWQWLADELSLH